MAPKAGKAAKKGKERGVATRETTKRGTGRRGGRRGGGTGSGTASPRHSEGDRTAGGNESAAAPRQTKKRSRSSAAVASEETVKNKEVTGKKEEKRDDAGDDDLPGDGGYQEPADGGGADASQSLAEDRKRRRLDEPPVTQEVMRLLGSGCGRQVACLVFCHEELAKAAAAANQRPEGTGLSDLPPSLLVLIGAFTAATETALRFANPFELARLAQLQKDRGAVVALTCYKARDGTPFVASAHSAGAISLWNLATRTHVASLDYPSDLVCLTSFLDTDGGSPLLVSSYLCGSVVLWDLETHTQLAELEGAQRLSPPAPLVSFTGQDGSRYIASGGETGIVVYDVTARRFAVELGGHSGAVSTISVCANPAGTRFLVSGSWDKTVRVWNMSTYKLEYSLEEEHGMICCVETFLDEHGAPMLLTNGADGSTKLWDLGTGDMVWCVEGPEGKYWTDAVCFAGRDGALHFARVEQDFDGAADVAIWNPSTQQQRVLPISSMHGAALTASISTGSSGISYLLISLGNRIEIWGDATTSSKT
jgi:WD40 repeat protein